MISILSTSKRGLPFFCGVFSKFIQETSITAIADKQCDVVLIILRCSTPMLCCLFKQNKIQTKENNKNKTDDHNKQVDQSGSLTNLNFEQFIYDVMDIFSIGIPCYIIILFVKCEQFNFYHPYAINSTRLATFIPFVSAGSCENLI